MWCFSILGLTLALSTAPPAAPAAKASEGPRKVAVLPFEIAGGLDASLGKTFSGALLGEVHKTRAGKVDLMAPDDVVQALPEPLRKRLKRCKMAACKAQMAQAVGADRALSGSLGKVGGTVVLNLALLESSDGSQVAQWTGKAAADAIDKLLDQLPAAVDALFPAPAPPPEPPPPPVVAAPPPPPPVVDPLLPPEDPMAAAPPPDPEPPPAPIPSAAITAQSDVNRPAVPGQVPVVAPPPEPEWSKALIGAALGVGIPAVVVGVVFLVLGVGSLAGSIAAHYGAYTIYQEVKSVPHKQTRASGDYDLSALILTGKSLYGGAMVGYGGAALLALLSAIALTVGIVGGAGLLFAAAPRERPDAGVKPRGGTQ